MFLKYTPDGGPAQEWTFKLGKLRSREIEEIERLTGLPYGPVFKEAVLTGNARCRRALLFTFLRRDHGRLRFDDVDFADDELVLEMDREELTELRASIETADGLPEADRAIALGLCDRELARAAEAPGKAPSPSDATSTASP